MAMVGRYKAFEGANGWYVAFERADGFHAQPSYPEWLSEDDARKEARRLNWERERDSMEGV